MVNLFSRARKGRKGGGGSPNSGGDGPAGDSLAPGARHAAHGSFNAPASQFDGQSQYDSELRYEGESQYDSAPRYHDGPAEAAADLEMAARDDDAAQTGVVLTGDGWLSAHDLSKSFKGRPVVRGVSLAVGRGQAVGLLGPNGAGKTTIFYMITGLIPADAGSIQLDGHDVTALPMYRRARLGIGYLPQETSIFRGLTVEQNIMAVLELVERSPRERARRLEQLLDEFKIGHLRKSRALALSGGERRRCEIARALACDPAYMLLDEPFAGIDPIAIADIRAMVRHLTDRGIGVLITDHNVRETLELIDRAYIIYDGEVLKEGTPEEIVASADVRRVYLGDMFT